MIDLGNKQIIYAEPIDSLVFEELSKTLDIEFPKVFQEFMMKFNGGEFDGEATFYLKSFFKNNKHEFTNFIYLSLDEETAFHGSLDRVRREGFADYLPFGLFDHEHYLAFKLNQPDTVFAIFDDMRVTNRVQWVSNSLQEFIDSLTIKPRPHCDIRKLAEFGNVGKFEDYFKHHDLSQLSIYGNNILHESIACGNVDLVKASASKGLDVNRVLGFAVESGCVECVKVLLEAGADSNYQYEDGRLPLDYLMGTAGHDKIAEANRKIRDLMMSYGARKSS